MADLRKLGKRGSYRLGRRRSSELGSSGARSRLSPVGRPPRQAMFRPHRSHGRLGWWLGACAAGAVVIAVAAEFGLWFAPFVVGLGLGLGRGLFRGVAAARAGWRLRYLVPLVLVMAVAGWGAPLLWQAVRGEPAGATARVIAALAGLPPYAVVGIVFTLLVASVQAMAGLWLGRAVTAGSRSR